MIFLPKSPRASRKLGAFRAKNHAHFLCGRRSHTDLALRLERGPLSRLDGRNS